MQIIIEIDDSMVDEITSAVKEKTGTALKNLDEIIADWLQQAARDEAIRAGEQLGAIAADKAFEARKNKVKAVK